MTWLGASQYVYCTVIGNKRNISLSFFVRLYKDFPSKFGYMFALIQIIYGATRALL